jgi:CheY-like chemotaxis protein
MCEILIIDDEEPIRLMLRTLLEKKGYSVADASNGVEGYKLFLKNPSNVVILDMLMPVKDGIETMISLKKDFPGVKIIAISGGGVVNPDVYLSLAQKLGADYTFQKPVEKNKLLSAVESLIQGNL